MNPLEQLTIKEAAEILGMTTDSVKYALKQGLFPFGVAIMHEKNYKYYIYKNKLKKWCESNES